MNNVRALDWESIEADYHTGRVFHGGFIRWTSVRKIAAKHGISHAAIYNRINRDGWTRGTRPREWHETRFPADRVPDRETLPGASTVVPSGSLPSGNASTCDDCERRMSCASRHLACIRFVRYVEGSAPIRWFKAPIAPTAARYASVFEGAA